jgi:predicted RNA polymerase sigma factor
LHPAEGDGLIGRRDGFRSATGELYRRLATLTSSPVVELNRALAVGMAFGTQVGLDLVEPLASHPALAAYPFLPAVRVDLLFKRERVGEARADFERAAALTRNTRDRELLLERARACEAG